MRRRTFLSAVIAGAAAAAGARAQVLGGARPATAVERAGTTVFDTAMLQRQLTSPVDFSDPAAVVAFYNRAYSDESQGPTGCCTGCCVTSGMMGNVLFQTGQPIPQLSWPFAYYAASQDATFSLGFTVGGVAAAMVTTGVCLDSLYSEAFVLQNWQNRFPYPQQYLPSQACYTNALNQRIAQFSAVNQGVTDWGLAAQIIRAGFPIAFGIGNHAVCAIAVSADDWWWYTKDSESADLDNGLGRGVRGFTRGALEAGAYDATVIQAVDWNSTIVTPPQEPQPVTYDQIIAAIQAGAGTWTAAQIAGLQSATAALSRTAPPPSADIIMPPATSGVDGAGNTWTQSYLVSDRYGFVFACNGRGLTTATQLVIHAGTVYADTVDGWTVFSGDPAAAYQWTPSAAP